jgi:hypothetical protein
MQATWLAADTEFWRAGRRAAGVLHFTTLGYSRGVQILSDHKYLCQPTLRPSQTKAIACCTLVY